MFDGGNWHIHHVAMDGTLCNYHTVTIPFPPVCVVITIATTHKYQWCFHHVAHCVIIMHWQYHCHLGIATCMCNYHIVTTTHIWSIHHVVAATPCIIITQWLQVLLSDYNSLYTTHCWCIHHHVSMDGTLCNNHTLAIPLLPLFISIM